MLHLQHICGAKTWTLRKIDYKYFKYFTTMYLSLTMKIKATSAYVDV
jgi:hypothetical protein